jgi:hypothetical protein
MVYRFAIAAFVVAGLFALWLGVQALVRKHSKRLAPDEDVLACRTCGAEGSCGGCAGAEPHNVRESGAGGGAKEK